MSCPFCVPDLEKSRVLKEGKKVFVMLSNPRLMPGHLLVIPKRHVERLSELTGAERVELMDMLCEFQGRVLSKLAKGCDVRGHYRPFLPPSRIKVNHFHFHLQPRELEDELYRKSQVFEKGLFQDLSREELERMVELLKG